MDHDMTLDPGTSRRLRDWLHETAEELPDDRRVLERVKASLPETRHAGWRSGALRRPLGWVAVAAVMALVMVAGLALRVSGPISMPGAPDTVIPMPETAGPLPPGRYRIPSRYLALGAGYEVTVDVPEGWSSVTGGFGVVKPTDLPPEGAGLSFWAIDDIHIDPCHASIGTTDRHPWVSLEWFGESLTGWWSDTWTDRPATAPIATGPAFGVFGGRSGFDAEVRVPNDVDLATCEQGRYVLWQDPDGDERWAQGPGQQLAVRVIAVEPRVPVPSRDTGTEPSERDPGWDTGFLVIDASTFPGTSPEVRAELARMVDSVRIEEVPGVSPGP